MSAAGTETSQNLFTTNVKRGTSMHWKSDSIILLICLATDSLATGQNLVAAYATPRPLDLEWFLANCLHRQYTQFDPVRVA
jgi:hypothetical protein